MNNPSEIEFKATLITGALEGHDPKALQHTINDEFLLSLPILTLQRMIKGVYKKYIPLVAAGLSVENIVENIDLIDYLIADVGIDAAVADIGALS